MTPIDVDQLKLLITEYKQTGMPADQIQQLEDLLAKMDSDGTYTPPSSYDLFFMVDEVYDELATDAEAED